jgi:HSP20 family protein
VCGFWSRTLFVYPYELKEVKTMARLIRDRSNLELWNTHASPERWLDAFFAPFYGGFPDEFAGDNLIVDLYETEDELVVKASLPGVKPEDIDLHEQQGFLTIRATIEAETTHQQHGWLIQERRQGAWQRTLRLPAAVKGSKARAELRDGVLRVMLPKEHPEKPLVNRIKVNLPKLKIPSLSKSAKSIKISHN